MVEQQQQHSQEEIDMAMAQQYQELAQSAHNPMGLSPYLNTGNMLSENVSIREIDNKKLIERIEHKLRGEVTRDGGKTYDILRTPYMTEEGIQDAINILESHLDQNTLMSNLKPELVDQFLKALRKDLILLLRFKYMIYKVDKLKMSIILDLLFNPILMAVKRSEDGDEKKYRSGYMSVGQQIIERPEQKRGKFLGMFSRD